MKLSIHFVWHGLPGREVYESTDGVSPWFQLEEGLIECGAVTRECGCCVEWESEPFEVTDYEDVT